MIGLERVLGMETSLVQTEPVRRLLGFAPGTIADGFAVVVYGPSGSGKTTALTELMSRHPGPVTAVSLDVGANSKEVIKTLHEAIVGRPGLGRRRELKEELRVHLAGDDRLIIIDEAQNGDLTGLEIIRSLWMDPSARWGLVLAGADLDLRLKPQAMAMMRTRIGLTVRFAPVDTKDIAAVLQSMHPAFAEVAPTILERANDRVVHGNLREWKALLSRLPQYLGQAKRPDRRDALELAIDSVRGYAVSLR